MVEMRGLEPLTCPMLHRTALNLTIRNNFFNYFFIFKFFKTIFYLSCIFY